MRVGRLPALLLALLVAPGLLLVGLSPLVAPRSALALHDTIAPQHAHAHGHDAPGQQGADGQHAHDAGPAGHEASEGLALAAGADPVTQRAPDRCAAGAPLRAYDVVATAVDITLNRYLDHDPQGRMYVLAEDLSRVRAEEARNESARAEGSEPAVSLGLQGDAIQPLTLRANQGECLRVRLRNELPNRELAGLEVHGAGLRVGSSGAPAVAASREALVAPGGTVTYEWMVDVDEREGTHYLHSPGADRFQTGHGLFGAVIVEPKGSTYLDPLTGRELRSGWAAIITTPSGKSFREAVLYYHEVGNEQYQLLDKRGTFVPLVDPLTTAYRPGARALNYRSEPFMNRLLLQQSLTGSFDESVAYGSYTFGDDRKSVV